MPHRVNRRREKGPKCRLCLDYGQVPGPTVVKHFANGVARAYQEQVACICRQPKPAAVQPQAQASGPDAQSRAAGEERES